MKKRSIFYIALILLLTHLTFGQQFNLSGQITDARTNSPLPFVSIYLSNTSYATESDSLGHFKLSNIPVAKYNLVVSMIGYQTFYQTIVLEGTTLTPINIQMQVAENVLNEVSVKAKRDKRWEKELQLFEKQFFGQSVAAKSCKILNPWVLDFEVEANKLKAIAHDVIQIQNDYLGYQIEYTLKHFIYDGTNTSFGGYTLFVPLGTTNSEQKEKWNLNRRQAFRNSELYFIKSLINQQTKSIDFEAFTDKSGSNPLERSPYFYQNQAKKLLPFLLDSLAQKDSKSGNWLITLPRRFELHLKDSEGGFSIYKDKICQVSWIETTGKSLIFNKDGLLLNPQDWVVSGYLSNGRIAELLPLNYRLDETLTIKPKPNFWKEQIEKPFFTTDKSYYFKGDLIQLSGIMVYENVSRTSSLSRIVRIELVNPKTSKVVGKQKVEIDDNGEFSTQIQVPDSIEAQTYVLRAYTQWMRNWGDSTASYRWLPILSKLENFDIPNVLADDKIEIQQKDSTVTTTLPLLANERVRWLSARVFDNKIDTDLPLPPLKTGNFISLPDTLKPKYEVEKGINLTGKTFDIKGQAVLNANITLLVPKLGLSYITTTDSSGLFRFENLPIEGEPQIILKATDLKNRALPNIELCSNDSLKVIDYGLSPQFKKRASETSITQSIIYEKGKKVIQLQEVEIKEKKNITPPKTIYGPADYRVLAKDIPKSALGDNILVVLQGRVPGVTVVDGYEKPKGEDFFPKKALIVTLRGGSTSNSFQATRGQPLILVDGVPFDDLNQLLAIPPSRVASIEVYNRSNNMSGGRGYYGIIAIYTKKMSDEETTEYTKDKNVRTFTLEGATHITKPTRSSIFNWEPNLSIDPMKPPIYEFPKPPKGNYSIVIEGVNKQGKIIKQQALFEIK